MPVHDSIRAVEAAAARAWPALEVASYRGWWLRYSKDVTRRGNSVWASEGAIQPEPADLDAAFGFVEAFYAARGLPGQKPWTRA
jgi:hypothetical protein